MARTKTAPTLTRFVAERRCFQEKCQGLSQCHAAAEELNAALAVVERARVDARHRSRNRRGGCLPRRKFAEEAMTKAEARKLRLARDIEEVHRLADAILAQAKRPPKRVNGQPTRKEAREAKRAARAAATQEVWDDCFLRFASNRGNCEACGRKIYGVPELDHFWGRAREESLESCWMLCRACHREKTENRPDRAHWLRTFGLHAKERGYSEQVAKCNAALALERAKHGRTTP